MNMASSASSTPSPNPIVTSNGGGGSGPPSAGASGQTSNNSSTNAGQQQMPGSNNPASDTPVSPERIACWITELLSSTTRENALMELSRKREKVVDLAVLLWHSFGSVAVLLHEVM
jgi:CCR4-NOT transcription complex subunit 9